MCEKDLSVSKTEETCAQNLPVFAIGTALFRKSRKSRKSNIPFFLEIVVDNINLVDAPPATGQFFMLRSKKSQHLLGRPISAYGWHLTPFGDKISLYFLILDRGGATHELLDLDFSDEVEVLGPLGNSFPLPNSDDKACLVSGGIGIAPIANLAENLPDKSYGLYVGFKDSSYGFPIPTRASSLKIATESGYAGGLVGATKGTIADILTAETLRENGYTVVYACGPIPMLKYIQKICREAGVRSYFSMENRMACGVGACLGCTIKTTEGNKRCCKDGPVFPGEIIIFDDESTEKPLQGSNTSVEPDLSVEIAGVEFKNPVIAASGTFGYGIEYETLVDLNALGGICSKGLTLEPRAGNDGVRIHELSSVGMMNSIGLENPGILHFTERELPSMLTLDTVSIANLSGSSLETYVEGAQLLDETKVEMIELNISCPNVKAGGMAFGMTSEAAEKVTRAVRAVTKKPLMVKLTPNAPDLVGVALAVKAAGADAISLVNTFQALAIDIETGRPVFNNTCAGYGGPGIKPIALRMIYDVARAIRPNDPDYPIIGLGGIATWQDAVEFIMAGATAIQVGTATFSNPPAMIEIIDGLRVYMRRKNFRSLADFRGILL